MALPKFMQEQSKKTKANKRETKVCKQLNSGSISLFKGDFTTEDSIIDHKDTEKHSYSITEELCEKMIEDTMAMGKENAILIIDINKRFRLTCKVEVYHE